MQKRSSIVGGTILIVVGLLFLLLQMVPGLFGFLDMRYQWPIIIIIVGAVFLFSAFAGTPPLAIPGSILTGIGSILYYQTLTGNWESWAYIWALIPGFVGVGLLLSGGLGHKAKEQAAGRQLLLISGILFVVFAAFFSGLGQLWPLVLIAFGLWLMLKNRAGSRVARAGKTASDLDEKG